MGASCAALLAAGATASGNYYVINPASADPAQSGKPVLVYCDQVTNGGGWALVHNSVLAPNTLDFWDIRYAQRLGRRGRPSLDANFYDGALYQSGSAMYMDVYEDLRGGIAVGFTASSTGIDSVTMRFGNPDLISGLVDPYTGQFARGWSAPDYDGDTTSVGNCAAVHNNVTQHYAGCWVSNLGSDADNSGGDFSDARVGPHVFELTLTQLSLFADGSRFSRVRRISRFVKW